MCTSALCESLDRKPSYCWGFCLTLACQGRPSCPELAALYQVPSLVSTINPVLTFAVCSKEHKLPEGPLIGRLKEIGSCVPLLQTERGACHQCNTRQSSLQTTYKKACCGLLAVLNFYLPLIAMKFLMHFKGSLKNTIVVSKTITSYSANL